MNQTADDPQQSSSPNNRNFATTASFFNGSLTPVPSFLVYWSGSSRLPQVEGEGGWDLVSPASWSTLSGGGLRLFTELMCCGIYEAYSLRLGNLVLTRVPEPSQLSLLALVFALLSWVATSHPTSVCRTPEHKTKGTLASLYCFFASSHCRLSRRLHTPGPRPAKAARASRVSLVRRTWAARGS